MIPEANRLRKIAPRAVPVVAPPRAILRTLRSPLCRLLPPAADLAREGSPLLKSCRSALRGPRQILVLANGHVTETQAVWTCAESPRGIRVDAYFAYALAAIQ